MLVEMHYKGGARFELFNIKGLRARRAKDWNLWKEGEFRIF